MLETFPALLLVIMLTLTLILLPRLNEEQQSNRTDAPRRTEELHIKTKRDA